MRVFVLIFNAGSDNEGIHSVRQGNLNKIMMFESEDDATRFALMLEAQDFPTPTVEEIDDQEIKDFCQGAGFDWELIPKDSNAISTPPELNVEETDWEQDTKNKNNTASASEMSDSDLDSIRRKLEGLL
ncbi:MAG: DUF3110 domain-containing protein [Sphaerospermopsis sp. SIO1G2]|nr:DUF3110 domain-containing protein [Sphaerospermopsis sp. SIO1G2]